MRGNCSLDPLGSKGVRQAASTFSISHSLAFTAALYFFGSPPRNFVRGLMVLLPFLSYSILPYVRIVPAGQDLIDEIGNGEMYLP